MRHRNHILTSVALVFMLALFSGTAMAQPKPIYAPLLFSMRGDTSVPPVYVGQPPEVMEGYLWLDEAMRNFQEYQIENFFNALTWSDTMKMFASVYYQAQDDNPLSFYMWSGNAIHPNPYKGNPGQAEAAFPRRLTQIVGDTGRTCALLMASIIADVMVGDTICVTDPTAAFATDQVLVNSTILDEIKGKQIPLCVGEDMRAHRKNGASILSSGTIPWATYPVPADTGTCLQFMYSPEWQRATFGGQEYGPCLIDSSGGWWVKPGHEYIVFLMFLGLAADSTHAYFTTLPGPAISQGGMYPVVDGIVQDPNDDFGLGATGLTVAEWKSRLRVRINQIVTE